MTKKIYSMITGSGSYLPPVKVSNEMFEKNEFYNQEGERLQKEPKEIIRKFYEITEIAERRYVEDNIVASDIGYFAAEDALESSGTDREELDYLIVAHNFGDVRKENPVTDMVPSLASRIKARLGIKNPYTVAFDLPFGCPGWLQGVIHADYFIRSGDAKKIMIVGCETLSRISDPHDIDSMLYSDGAGAVILNSKESDHPTGILSHLTRSDTLFHSSLLSMGKSYNPFYQGKEIFLKMNGRKLYEYALNTVPQMVKDCIDKAGILFQDIKKILIHQANAKMNEAIMSRILKLFGVEKKPEGLMPMTINKLGNSSVATIPTLLDLILKKKLPEHQIFPGDYLVFASVGAGMNVNVLVYKMPE